MWLSGGILRYCSISVNSQYCCGGTGMDSRRYSEGVNPEKLGAYAADG